MEVKQILETTSGEEKIDLICGRKDSTVPIRVLPALKIDNAVGAPVYGAVLPSPLAVACSWDKDLSYGVGRELGRLCCESGIHVSMRAPQLLEVKSPFLGGRWRRLSTEKELSAQLAFAYIDGVQSTGVGACAPICEDGEAGKDDLDRLADEICGEKPARRVRALSCEGKTDGERVGQVCGGAKYLKERGYLGTVIAGAGTAYDRSEALAGGVDLSLASERTDVSSVLEGMLSGKVSGERVNIAALKVLELIDETYDDHEYFADEEGREHNLLRFAEQCPVLLKNEGVLPLLGDSVTVMGALCESFPISGEEGGGYVGASLRQALREDRRVKFVVGYDENDADGAVSEALESTFPDETVVVVLGEKHADIEGVERRRALPECQVRLVERLGESARAVVAVVVAGGEVDLERVSAAAKAVLFVPYLGQAAARAVKKILCGESAPCGRLPEDFFSSDLSRVLYPLGSGKSYGEFAYGNIRLDSAKGKESLSFTLTNNGRYFAAETVEVFFESGGTRRLLAFEKVRLRALETRAVTVPLPSDFSGERLLVCAGREDVRLSAEIVGEHRSGVVGDEETEIVRGESDGRTEKSGITLMSTPCELSGGAGRKMAKLLKSAALAATQGDGERADRILAALSVQPMERLVRLGVLKRSEAEVCVLTAANKPLKALGRWLRGDGK